MDAGVHLPQIEFAGEELSLRRLADAVDAARENGFAAVSVNDHFLFGAPWLDGLTALAAVAERSGPMTLATTVSLAALRGPVPLAKALATLDILSGGRVLAGVGPGSSRSDYDALGVGFESRWQRFEESVTLLRALLNGAVPPAGGRYFAVPEARLLPVPRHAGPVPLWIGSWGSAAGLRRVARLGDGWLASAYNTTPAGFAAARARLRAELAAAGRPADDFPHALVTMWTWITEDHSEAERVITGRLAPLLKRDPATLRGRVCVGPAGMCAELLSGFAEAGCRRVHFWPLGAEPRQIDLIASTVLPGVCA
jgi:alkanesulfonate monooxygenase SsuD/methylene tetrahydromethanopterin reductase-like flavin-dependent oxidoreductase (luciferase family)